MTWEDIRLPLTCIICDQRWTSVEQQQDRILFKPCGHMRTTAWIIREYMTQELK